jgi:hypothetical protein
MAQLPQSRDNPRKLIDPALASSRDASGNSTEKSGQKANYVLSDLLSAVLLNKVKDIPLFPEKTGDGDPISNAHFPRTITDISTIHTAKYDNVHLIPWNICKGSFSNGCGTEWTPSGHIFFNH